MNPPNAFRVAQETQVVLFLILFVASAILAKKQCIWGTLVWFGVTGLLRAFADVQSESWEFYLPRNFNVIGAGTFTLLVLYIDLAFVVYLVAKSGGSELSCFTPLYFLLPTFALLILGVGLAVCIYAGVAILCFCGTLFFDQQKIHRAWISGDEHEEALVFRTRIANAVVSGACLFLVVFFDYRVPKLHKSGTPPVPEQPSPSGSPALRPPPAETPTVAAQKPTPAPKPTTAEGAKRSALPTPTPISPTTTPDASTESSAKPPGLPPGSLQPPPSTSEPNSSKDSSSSYAVFLKPFYSTKLTKKKRSFLLKRSLGKAINWEVKFDTYEKHRNELYIFFARSDGRPLPTRRPIAMAKLSNTTIVTVEQLRPGSVIRIRGRLERHSYSQLFVQASKIR